MPQRVSVFFLISGYNYPSIIVKNQYSRSHLKAFSLSSLNDQPALAVTVDKDNEKKNGGGAVN